MSSLNRTFVIVLGVAIALFGLVRFFAAFGAGGLLSVLLHLVLAVILMAVGAQFALRRHWAFVATSLLVLGGFFYFGFDLVMAVDTADRSAFLPAVCFIADVALIGYLGRWRLERHFAAAQ